MRKCKRIRTVNLSASKKRIKVDGGESQSELSSSLCQLETRLPESVTPENSVSGDSTCESVNASACCCSSNESNELAKEDSEFVDLEEENDINVERNAIQKMPSETELEEFFAAAEKDLQKQFCDKYNFDILEDKPLEGRYEWTRLRVTQ